MKDLKTYLAGDDNLPEQYKPTIFRLTAENDKNTLEELFKTEQVSSVQNEIYGQLQELIKSKNPSVKIKANEYPALIETFLAGRDIDEFGVWVYYPWSKHLVHLLDEDDFIEVRTNRNQYKITREEQRELSKKKIGIIGLSVGQSIALTMAMERIFGELRLADFDTAELSNLNRIRTGVQNLGLNKTVIVAREIAEIDPFLKVTIFSDGLTEANMDRFFTGDGRLDLLVEVCDGLDIKILSRYKARELQIPVIMDTNDKGMLDVERFDLEPNRDILHGLANGLDPQNIKDLSNEDKIPYILKMIGAETISTRLKASMLEVEQSINTWPQLASSVTLGGALTTDVSRRLLLDQFHASGRYYVDMEELVKDEDAGITHTVPETYIGPPELTADEMLSIVNGFLPKGQSVDLPEAIINQIVEAGVMAPSGGNTQPWKFLYSKKGIFLFHDEHFSFSLLDFAHLGSYVSIGAVIENIRIKASALGFGINYTYFPVQGNRKLVAHIAFNNFAEPFYAQLEAGLNLRVTNRDLTTREVLSQDYYHKLSSSINSIDGAALHIIDSEALMAKLGKILGRAEMLRIIHPRGHYDTFTQELRWTPEEITKKRDGMDVNSLGATNSELAGFKVAADRGAIGFLRQLKGGNAFTKMVNKAVAHSSALAIITMPGYSETAFLEGGQAVERIWTEANLAGISFQPISQLVFMMAMLNHDPNQMQEEYRSQVAELQSEFYQLFPELSSQQLIFIFRLSKGGTPKVRSLRRSIQSLFVNADKA
jgi:molybdopterin/thiamine biosynthesis adenylyltransferase